MTLAEFYMTIEGMFRQTGRTTVLVKAAKAIDGLFIVHTEGMKREMLKKYPDLNCESMSTTKLFGNRKPIILDHFVVHQLLLEATKELVKLRSDIQQQKFIIQNLEERIEEINI